jgi:beta-phosphoglucomutase
MSKDKLAIFDLDGTLFNTDEVNYHAYSEAMKPFGVELDHDMFVTECNGKHYKVFAPGIMGGVEHLEEMHEAKKRLYSEFVGYAKINEHLFDIIRGIKDSYYIALVTTASKKNTDDIIDHFGVAKEFDFVITQEDISKPKPDPEGFMKAIEHFNMDVKNVYIYEDSDVGVEAARRTGASVIVVDKWA